MQMTVPGRDALVTLHLWYPTESDAATVLLGQNGLFYGEHVRPDAVPLAGPLPVVVLSHGSGGNAPRLGWLAGYLASEGMIVAAPDHPGTTSGDSDPFRTPLVWERIADLTAALDLLESAPPVGLQPDMSRVASLGFSLGGYSALGLGGVRVTRDAFIAHCSAKPQAADCAWMVAAGVDFTAVDAARYDADHRDPRVKATVAIDPALVAAVDQAALAGLTLPVLVINQGEAATLPDGLDASGLAAAIPGAEYVAIPGGAFQLSGRMQHFRRDRDRSGGRGQHLLGPWTARPGYSASGVARGNFRFPDGRLLDGWWANPRKRGTARPTRPRRSPSLGRPVQVPRNRSCPACAPVWWPCRRKS